MAKKKVTAPEVPPIGPFNLRAVYIKHCEMDISPDFDPLIPNQPLVAYNKISSGEWKCRETIQEEKDAVSTFKSCSFSTTFHFGYILNNGVSEMLQVEDENNFVANIMAEIVVDYLITSPEFPDHEALRSWGESNSIIHCWPYWREFCHNAQLRMNLPVAMVPLLNLQPRPK